LFKNSSGSNISRQFDFIAKGFWKEYKIIWHKQQILQ
jgi:hypothetical protein